MAENIILSRRLLSCARFVRCGSAVLDVGTDHCYIPLYLWQNGICTRLYASDVKAGPVDKAKANLIKYGAYDCISVYLADGLDGAEKTLADDIIIAGMGGELIAKIIQNDLNSAKYTENSNVRLILQPMTKSACLRRFLAENGFVTEDERLTPDGERIYETLCVHYNGEKREITEAECVIGGRNVQNRQDCFEEYVSHKLNYYISRIDGLKKSVGADADGETAKLMELCEDIRKLCE